MSNFVRRVFNSSENDQSDIESLLNNDQSSDSIEMETIQDTSFFEAPSFIPTSPMSPPPPSIDIDQFQNQETIMDLIEDEGIESSEYSVESTDVVGLFKPKPVPLSERIAVIEQQKKERLEFILTERERRAKMLAATNTRSKFFQTLRSLDFVLVFLVLVGVITGLFSWFVDLAIFGAFYGLFSN